MSIEKTGVDEAQPFGASLPPAGTWWRATRYRIDNGVIRPALDATFDNYDPWSAYTESRRGWGGGGAPPPYAALLDLAWRVRLLPPRTRQAARLTSESEALVLDWCAEHGLLGLLLQRTEAVYYAARWRNVQVDDEGRREGVLQPVRLTYTWGGTLWEVGGWTQAYEPWSIPSEPSRRFSIDNDEGIYEGNLVPPDVVVERWQPQVLIRRPVDASYELRELGSEWGPFFQDVVSEDRSTHEYPWPGSEQWWRYYGEPIGPFVEALDTFLQALTTLEPGTGPSESWAVQHFGLPTAGQRAFQRLLQEVRPTLYRSPEGIWVGGWRTKSLLGSYAMMAYLDVLDEKRILACDLCGKPYVSGAYQARYCSERCRNTAVKRAYRDRQRAKARAR